MDVALFLYWKHWVKKSDWVNWFRQYWILGLSFRAGLGSLDWTALGWSFFQLAGYESNYMRDQNLNKVKNILQKISKRLKID